MRVGLRRLADRRSFMFVAACVSTALAWQIGEAASDGTVEWTGSYGSSGEALISRDTASIMHFQQPQPQPSVAAATGCPHAGSGLVPWNSGTLQWPGRVGPPPADGSDITLPSNTALLISAGFLVSSASAPYGKTTVPATSRIVFDDPGAGSSIEMDLLGMQIDGVVEAGAPTCRLAGKIVLTLHGEFSSAGSSERSLFTGQDDPLLKGIAASSQSRLDLHGALFFPTWTRLAAHVPGSTATGAPASRNSVIYLQDCVNRIAGQTVAVTTTHHKDTRGYSFNEERIIAPSSVKCVSINGKQFGQLTLTQALTHYHHAYAIFARSNSRLASPLLTSRA